MWLSAKAIEAEFLLRAGGDAAFAFETRLFVLDSIFSAARKTGQPFDTCRDIWNEVRSLGFGESGMEYMMTTLYAECCIEHKEAEAGIAVVEPIIAKTKQLLADPTVKKEWKRSYRDDLRTFQQFLGEFASAASVHVASTFIRSSSCRTSCSGTRKNSFRGFTLFT